MGRKVTLWLCLVLGVAALVGCIVIAWRQGWIQKAWDSPPNFMSSEPGYYRVKYVYDGDTILIDMDGVDEKVRLIGVDTPETHDPDVPVQCYGQEATDFTNSTLLGKNVRLESDPTNTNRDRYDRLLRYVYLKSGELINSRLIRDGYGFAYVRFPFVKKDEFLTAEENAKSSAVGLWKVCTTFIKDGVYQTTAR